MRLPRRVPWASISELEQLCTWIYTDENDHDATTLAVNRLAAWRAITPLPHALDSTLAILVVIAQDSHQHQRSSLSLRQSYATAIIRLVNGLVDPLQLGAYARSIASIAKQLGLPSWLVELRHAATHEELPSLSLLREAARQSLSWLLHNYFLPTINPLSSPSSFSNPLRPLKPILKQYKECMKTVTRDASLASQYKPTICGLLRDIERWIAEAEVVANISMDAVGWESHQSSENATTDHDVNLKEKWALERLCDDLLEKGGLVPLSKKKRSVPKNQVSPPAASIAIWGPLLQNLQDLHADFSSILTNQICSRLLGGIKTDTPEDEISLESKSEKSYEICLGQWVVWLVDMSSTKASVEYDLRQEAVAVLLRDLGSALTSVSNGKSSALNLLETLCEGQEELQVALQVFIQPSKQNPIQEWKPSDMDIMQDRLDLLQNMASSPTPGDTVDVSPESQLGSDDIVAPGWRQLSYRNWRPCPIGVYVSV